MRAAALLTVALGALAVGAVSMGGAAAASQQQARTVFQVAASPSWSPDGKQVAFAYIWSVPQKNCCGLPQSLQPSRYRIVRRSSRLGGAVRTVLAAKGWCCGDMQWVAGGRLLSIPNSRGLRSMGVAGGKPKPLVFPGCKGGGPNCNADAFILTPNRRYAAVMTDDSDPHTAWGIALVRLGPGRDPAVVPSPLTAEEQGAVFDAILGFSPDGRQLVFSRSSWDGWNAGPPAVRAIRVGGGDSVPLAQSGLPGASLVPNDAQRVQWSPNGAWISYLEWGYIDGNPSLGVEQKLEVVATAGASTPRVLATCGAQSEFRFSWSPIAKSIAYNCTPGTWTGGQFMTVSPDGTHLTDLLKSRSLQYVWHFGLAGPQWSPDGSRLLFLAHRISHRIVHVWTVRANGHDLTQLG
jgi:WD40-like Beta Propeller Repeat